MHLIFDFDGTLVDSFNCLVNKFISLADQFGFRKIEPDEIDRLRDLSSLELIQHLDIPFYKIPKIIAQVRKDLHADMPRLLPIDRVSEVCQKLYDAGLPLGIMTSNSEENVEIWLKQHGMRHLFNYIHTESNFFSKDDLLKKILAQYQIEKAKAFYIGDETRDIEAAKKNAINAVAVTWGYNSENTLLKYQPHHIAHKPENLLTILKVIS